MLFGLGVSALATTALCTVTLARAASPGPDISVAQAAAAASGSQPAQSPPGARTALGDLSVLRAHVVEALKVAEAGDLKAARERMKAVEEDWDRSERAMKARAPAEAEALDSAIDRARRELWFWRAWRTDSAEALQAVISTIDSMEER